MKPINENIKKWKFISFSFDTSDLSLMALDNHSRIWKKIMDNNFNEYWEVIEILPESLEDYNEQLS